MLNLLVGQNLLIILFFSRAASEEDRFTEVVVFPTPPF